jgi:hypothetical protein
MSMGVSKWSWASNNGITYFNLGRGVDVKSFFSVFIAYVVRFLAVDPFTIQRMLPSYFRINSVSENPGGLLSGKHEKRGNNVLNSSFLPKYRLSELKTFEPVTLISLPMCTSCALNNRSCFHHSITQLAASQRVPFSLCKLYSQHSVHFLISTSSAICMEQSS